MRALLTLLVVVGGCVNTSYSPRVLARGELVVTNHDGLEMHAGGKRVARSIQWNGLEDYVRCVPEAQRHAATAGNDGRTSLAFSILGGTLGILALGGLVGLADEPHLWDWLGAGVGAGVLGVVFAGSSLLLRNHANGHAVDAMNYYNDAVGSQGRTCADAPNPPQ
jgi:hypothetical protein